MVKKWIKKQKNKEKFDELLEEKFDCYYFDVDSLFDTTDKELYEKTLNMFHYIFSLGEEGKIYLWNKFVNLTDFFDQINKEDYSNEEIELFNDLAKVSEENFSKYGTNNPRVNINKEIESSRLLIKPYDWDLNFLYNEYFHDNKDEYENFYGTEYRTKDGKKADFIVNLHMNRCPLGFALVLKDSGEFIGSVVITDIKKYLYNVEYFIKKEYRNRGYAKEACKVLIEKIKSKELKVLEAPIKEGVFDEVAPDIRCLKIFAFKDNIASQSLALSLGFEYAGTLLFEKEFKGNYIDEVVYYMVINDNRKIDN